MPKVIEHLREDILGAAGALLLRDGYGALTIRSVAKKCGIAVGTVYNYFPSKEMLTAGVILADWQDVLGELREKCGGAAELREGLQRVYEAVNRFSEKYHDVWAGYSFRGTQQTDFARRHRLLVRQLADCLDPLLTRDCPGAPEGTDVFLAENILNCVDGSELTFDRFLVLAEKVLR